MTENHGPVVRRLARTAALAPAVLLPLAAAPAWAAPPEQWADTEPVSMLYALVLLAGVPLLLFVVIAFLVYAPSMARGGRYTPGLAWHNENEWFGGPDGGVQALDTSGSKAVTSAGGSASGETAGGSDVETDTRGGAHARW